MGDGGEQGDTCPLNLGEIFFWQLSRTIREFCQFSGKYHVKYGHFVNFFHTYNFRANYGRRIDYEMKKP